MESSSAEPTRALPTARRRRLSVPPDRPRPRSQNPATHCGICGFKPTVDRLSTKGSAVPRLRERNGQIAIRSSPGPLARCVADLELAMRVWCAPATYALDASLPPLGWDAKAYAAKGKLRIGYYESDGWFAPAAAHTRAVREAVAALKAAGHEVVPFPADEMAKLPVVVIGLLTADGKMRNYVDALQGEAMHPAYTFLYNASLIPSFLRPLIARVLRMLGDERKANNVLASGGATVHDYWQQIAERDALRASFLGRFAAAGLDAIVCPAHALPAYTHGASTQLNHACCYHYAYNAFNCPAGTVPVTTVAAGEEAYNDPSANDGMAKLARKMCAGSAGLPVGVQVVGAPWRDELTLRVMKELEAALGREAVWPKGW